MERSSDPEQGLLAKKIGGRYARNAMFVGLLCAAVILMPFDDWNLNGAIELVTNWPLQSAICLVGGPLIGTLFGRWAGKEVLINNRNAFFFSLATGFMSVLATTLLFSSVAFIGEGLLGSAPLQLDTLNYIAKPLYWTLLFASPVIVLVAGIMALFLRWARKRYFTRT
ncbi:MAG: hypothetical protein K8H89_16205 [Flavobacteriales bacterium]|nr:hypothetical protein [Flavobacteriales bacterium]